MRLKQIANVIGKEVRRAISARFDTRAAILGDENGVVDVLGTTDKVYVRYAEGVDANGLTVYSQPQIVSAGVEGNYLTAAGRGVRVGLDDYGELAVKRSDVRDVNASGTSIRVLNQARPETKFVSLGQISLLMTRPVGNASNPSFLVNVQQLWYDHYNAINKWRGTEILTDKIDLEPFVPSAGNQCVVCLFLDTYNNSIQVTASTTQTIDTVIDKTDYDECFAQRNAETIPIGSYVLADDQAFIDSKSIALDMRQLINVPETLGYANPIEYRARLRSGQSLVNAGTLVVNNTFDVLGTLHDLG